MRMVQSTQAGIGLIPGAKVPNTLPKERDASAFSNLLNAGTESRGINTESAQGARRRGGEGVNQSETEPRRGAVESQKSKPKDGAQGGITPSPLEELDDELEQAQTAALMAIVPLVVNGQPVMDELIESGAEADLVSILEGSQLDQIDMDIEPEQAGAVLQLQPESDFAAVIEETVSTEDQVQDTARMPQTENANVDTNADDLARRIESESARDSYPLENESETVGSSAEGLDETERVEKPQESDTESGFEQGAGVPVAIDITPERVTSANRLSGNIETPTVTRDQLFDTMVQRFETSQTENNRTMEIQLRPEFLGKVTIQLSMGETGLSARILSDDIGVRAMINGQLQSLIETLNERGIRVENVDVVYTGVSDRNADFSQQGGNAQQQGGGNNSRFEPEGYSNLPPTTWENVLPDIDSELSSVEYRA